MLPHSDFGASEWCGLLLDVVRGDIAQIECNECVAVVGVVPPAELKKTLTEMELELRGTTETVHTAVPPISFQAFLGWMPTSVPNADSRSKLQTGSEAALR
jgi:hypothetical protein